MAECPDGRTNRGTRSQFRIGLGGLGLCKGFYPINLGKIMDAGQSSQISSSSTSSRDLISPCKGSHTLTVREYEQTIDELKKENFDLKLKLYLCDETHKKACRDNDCAAPNDEMVQVIVHLTSETDSLRTELRDKDKLLQDALERAEKLESDIQELEKINADLQSELTSFSELPSKEEILLLLEEKEQFVNSIESLETLIKEKDEEIDTLNQKIEILANENTHLEEKVKKRSLAIQGFVYKSYKEKEMLPNELRNIVISATQAAKNKNKDDVAVAVKTFNSALNNIMSASELSLNQSEEKENIGSPSAKCLNKESFEKPADSFISSQSVSSSQIAQLQDLKEVLAERNLPDTEQTKKLDSFVHHSYGRGKMVHQNAVNIAENDVIEFCDISPSTEENLISFSEKPTPQTCTVTEHDLIDVETVSSSSAPCKLIPKKDIAESDEIVNILRENEQLKLDLKESRALIEDLRAACKEWNRVNLQKRGTDAFKASQQYCASTQTEIAESNLVDEYDLIKLQKHAKLSNNVEELREDILKLLLANEEKNLELSELKQSLAVVQDDLKKASSTTSLFDKDFYMHERNELHERLALSCSVNEELMKQLKNLERFMEDLLQHKFDSSLELSTEKLDFMSSVSKCLNESLNLSRILSDHLSVCEGSKLFEECDSFVYRNVSSEDKDLPYLGLNRLSMAEQQSSYIGSRTFEEYISCIRKNNPRIGKESDSSQLCWRCWQELSLPLNQSDTSHLIQNNTLPKPVDYPSSDSDIWSEPDRNVSMQRIGISLQNSPVSSKSPRKPRLKDKRISSRISSKEDTSSSEYQQALKKRLGSASRRLFSKETVKIQDFALDKYYFLVAEKYSKLKSLLEDLENINSGKLSNDGWIRLNRLVLAVGETLQKLHFAKETAKTTQCVCGKCVMLELYSNLKASHVETDFFIEEDSSEQKILQEFSRELCFLKQSCKEPFLLLEESVDKKSISTQSEIWFESEQTQKWETIINDLNARNDELNENLEKVKQFLSKEKSALASVKTENSHLLSEVDSLKIDLVAVKYSEKELARKNEKLANELAHFSKLNSELNSKLGDVEEKSKESSQAVDQLTAELEKNKSELIHMTEKCLENEKQLNEQIHMRENSENKLKTLEAESLRERNDHLLKIKDLNAEKDNHVQELRVSREKIIDLEKEKAVISDRLQYKNDELLSLKERIEKLQSFRETQNDIENGMSSKEKEAVKIENRNLLNQIDNLKKELLNMQCKEKEHLHKNKSLLEELNHINKNNSELNSSLKDLQQKLDESCSSTDQLKDELQKNRSDLIDMDKKCLEYKEQLNEQIQIREKCEKQMKSLKKNSLDEKQKCLNQLDALNAQNKQYEEELQNIKEKMDVLEKENAAIRTGLQSKTDELLSLQQIMDELQNMKDELISDNEKAKQLLTKANETSESIKIENLRLSNQINELEGELSNLRNKEKELNSEKEKLAEELKEVNENNSKLNDTLKVLEQKRTNSNVEIDNLTAELQKNKSDLINLNEKCLEYEKQLNEQIRLRENSENKLKNLESESLRENDYYLRKINDLESEKSAYYQELKEMQEKRLALEKENAIINERLQSKSSELLSLKSSVEKLQSTKETQHDIENESASKEQNALKLIQTEKFELLEQVSHLKEQLLDVKFKEKELSLENRKLNEELDHIKKYCSEVDNNLKHLKQEKEESSIAADQLRSEYEENKLDLAHMNKKCLDYEKQLSEQSQMREKFESQLKSLEFNSSSEKQKYHTELQALIAERNNCKQELKDVQEKMHILEKENEVINSNIQSKNDELLSLQQAIEKLENTKKALISDYEKTKQCLSEAKESLESFKIKNLELSNRINELEDELLNLKNKENEITLENEKLAEKLKEVGETNSKLNVTLKALEQKKEDANVELDKLTTELQKNKSELSKMSKKCLEYEKKLNEQIHLRENSESKLKNVESESRSDKNYYLSKISDLNAEKTQYYQELKEIQEKRLALEKENAIINDRLQSKDNELLSLKRTVEKLQSIKEMPHDIEKESLEFNSLREKRKYSDQSDALSVGRNNYEQELKVVQKKMLALEKENAIINDRLQSKNNELLSLKRTLENLQSVRGTQLDIKNESLECNSLSEKQKYSNQYDVLSAGRNNYEQELKDVQEKMLVLEKEKAVINSSLQSKNDELMSRQETIEKLQNAKEAVISDHEKTKQLLSKAKESESYKIQNLKLSNQIKQLEDELSHLRNKEKELTLKNEQLAEELNKVNESNSKLLNTLKVLELKKKDSDIELDQLTDELQKKKSDLVLACEKCSKYEKQLKEQVRLIESRENTLKTLESDSLSEKNYYLREIDDLSAEKNRYFQELESAQEKKVVLEKEIKTANDKLQSKNDELSCLQKTVEELQNDKEILDSNYEKLQLELVNCQKCVTNLQGKCKNYEAIVVRFKENEAVYSEKLKQLKAKSATEKEKLSNEISALTKDKEDILQNLKEEKDRYKKLKAEGVELKDNYLKSSQLVSTLKQRNEFFDNALISSNKECESLNKELKSLRNTLQNLESKCLSYEKQLIASSGMKDSLVECLLNINNEFSVQRQKLNEMCKIHGKDNSVVWDDTSLSKLIPVIDEDNVSKLCENTVLETKKLSQSVDMLFSILKSHRKAKETERTSEVKNQIRAQKKQKELHQTETETLRLQNDKFQHVIHELQKRVSEKENIIQCNDSEIQKLKEKLRNSQKENDRINQLIHRKDNEITMLQERIFNLQTYVDSIMTEKKNMLEKSTSMTVKHKSSDFSNNQLPPKTVLTDTKMCQTDEWESATQSVCDSASSVEAGKRHCCEKVSRKNFSLQTKLTLWRKRIDALEKDRNDLKERLLQELQSKKDYMERSNNSEGSKLVELESKLEMKNLFINELKNELLKTCNALIDKEKEVDNLKQELAECKDKSKYGAFDLSKRHPIDSLSSGDVSVKTLKNHKWRLIQTIFDIQKKFYEKKGIHLKYFDKFKEHVNNLYSLQLTPSVSKSESMPHLRLHAVKEQYEEKSESVKKMADLELDIECLENLKIFLNRFLEPCVFKMPETSDKEAEIKQKTVSSDRLSLPVKIHKDSKHEITDILNLSFPEAFIMAEDEKALRIDVVASSISQHLDYIEKFVDAVTTKNWSDILILSVEDSVDKVKVKSLLLKIVQEIDGLHERIDKLFNFNAQLKIFDFVVPLQVPLSTTRLDASDRESVLSEETIAVSRTESPMSFEDTCPIKLPHPEKLELEEALKLGSVGNRVTVTEPYSNKITVIDGSCDSVCQRSHYSSPDLGIESDPNHDSSAPEHKEEGTSKYQRFIREEQIFPLKPQPKTAFPSAESAGRWPGPKFGETFYAVGSLPHYELLKQEIKEGLVAIKSVLSRTGDGLHHIAKYTSPRKTLEYNTLKSIKDTCVHMEVCLKEANNLIGKFWTAPCPTEKEWKMLKEENQKQLEDLILLKAMLEKQELEFKKARGKLEQAQAVKDTIEKKISKKLVKTKKMIRQAELKLLENKCQNFPPLPKYPSEQREQTDTINHAH